MEGHLNLIKTDYKETEKRIFPRFPFTYLTFKANSGEEQVFEVLNISYTGMQVSLKNGGCDFKPDSAIGGDLHWRGASINISGSVKWVKGQRLGIAFDDKLTQKEIPAFLSIENIVAGMRPVHDSGLDIEMPNNLKYWLRADGPVEVFVWEHNDHETSRFQIIMMDSFVEWEDGKGLRTGNVINKRNVETPLNAEDEYIFEIDQSCDEEKIKFASRIISHIPKNFLPENVTSFLSIKIGA
ncbi:MAG: hypothetical protein CME70_15075 [Halobacteriovorax sp.]|nr:hypothetical protein [Halobacteriovorax sp.]|tara:strand:+ start:115211 stop:115930 length:720 start_codon:yes stop_codon:yes gene_type:complete